VHEERDAEIRELARQGVPAREIARRVGLSKSRVNQIAGGGRLRVSLRSTRRGLEVVAVGTATAELRARVERAFRLAKIDVE